MRRAPAERHADDVDAFLRRTEPTKDGGLTLEELHGHYTAFVLGRGSMPIRIQLFELHLFHVPINGGRFELKMRDR